MTDRSKNEIPPWPLRALFGSATIVALLFVLWSQWNHLHLLVEVERIRQDNLAELMAEGSSDLRGTVEYVERLGRILDDAAHPDILRVAEEAYRLALRLDPLNADMWLRLAWIRLELGSGEDARLALETGRRLGAENPVTQIEALRLLSFIEPERISRQTLERFGALPGEALRPLLGPLRRQLRIPAEVLFRDLSLARFPPSEAIRLLQPLEDQRATSLLRDIWTELPEAWLRDSDFAEYARLLAERRNDWGMAALLWSISRGGPIPSASALPPPTLRDRFLIRILDLALKDHPWSPPPAYGFQPPPTHLNVQADWRPPGARLTTGFASEDGGTEQPGELRIVVDGTPENLFVWPMIRFLAPPEVRLRLRFEYRVEGDAGLVDPELVLMQSQERRSSHRLAEWPRGLWQEAEVYLTTDPGGGLAFAQLQIPRPRNARAGRTVLYLRRFTLEIAPDE